MINTLGKLTAAVLPAAALALASWAVASTPGGGTLVNPRPPRPALLRYVGVSVPLPLSRNLAAFTSAAGAAPGIVEIYQRFGRPFKDTPAGWLEQRNELPLIQWNPSGVRLAAIAAGRYDGYLRRYADQARGFRARLVISFGHEMNGPWWSWSAGHQPAAAYTAAWRHIHDVFAAEGAANVIWCWNPNVKSSRQVGPPARWWPGAKYVDWVALDGYYWNPSYTFGSVFNQALAQLRRLAPGKPVIIAETGTYPGARQPARITNLLAAAARDRLAGVIYFDHRGHFDWRIKPGTATAAALRAAVTRYVRRR